MNYERDQQAKKYFIQQFETGNSQERNTNSGPSNNLQLTTTTSSQPIKKNTSKLHGEEDIEPRGVPK